MLLIIHIAKPMLCHFPQCYHCLFCLQGIIERDISVIRKETEIASLTSDLTNIKGELAAARKTIFSLQVKIISAFITLGRKEKQSLQLTQKNAVIKIDRRCRPSTSTE